MRTLTRGSARTRGRRLLSPRECLRSVAWRTPEVLSRKSIPNPARSFEPAFRGDSESRGRKQGTAPYSLSGSFNMVSCMLRSNCVSLKVESIRTRSTQNIGLCFFATWRAGIAAQGDAGRAHMAPAVTRTRMRANTRPPRLQGFPESFSLDYAMDCGPV